MRHGSAIWHCISPECQNMLRLYLSPDFVVPLDPDKPTIWVPGIGDPYKDLENIKEIDKVMRQRPVHLRHIT